MFVDSSCRDLFIGEILTKYNLSLNKLDGMKFNIINDEWSISSDLSINYIGKFIKN